MRKSKHNFIASIFMCSLLLNLDYIVENDLLSIKNRKLDVSSLQGSEEKKVELPFKAGEQLLYDVFYKSMRIGEATLTFHGEETLEGREVYHISLFTNLKAFKDREEIYADRETLLPVRVIREVSQLGLFPAWIREDYDLDNFKVTIHKKGRFLSKKYTIDKACPINNAILLPYYYRINADTPSGQPRKITLPTLDFELVSQGVESISTGIGEKTAVAFSSVPDKFKFWLGNDGRRLPLKIESLNSFGYSMVIKSVSPELAKLP